MKEIINWLREVEHLANIVYEQAASIYVNDPEFKRFFHNIAEDEAYHYHVMGSAAEYLASKPIIISAISVDKEIQDKIINNFYDMKNGLEQNTLSRDELINIIVETEFSEWNSIFLYTVNVLKEESNEFRYPAARIQAHLKGIENFLEKVENRPEILKKITALSPVWMENILIVDDMPEMTDLIKHLLNRSGNIDVAYNGQEAMELIEKKFYKLIISDINMPIMDGLTLFNKAVAKFPKLKGRFLFTTGGLSPERQSFFDENRVKYLEKPMGIKVLRDEAEKIILSK
ncbi:MAG: response regulator [Candidatus Brocadiales bacterium]|nr:response regulator [Candidatus Brocadiales bacterium]